MSGTFDTRIDLDEVPFSIIPTSVPGLALWLDPTDGDTITSSGGGVSQWDDKSGNGHSVIQVIGGLQPVTGSSTINGKNVFEYDGNAILTNTSFQDFSTLTMFAVANYDLGPSTMSIVDISDGVNTLEGAGFKTSGSNMESYSFDGDFDLVSIPIITAEPVIHRCVIDGTSNTYNINRNQVSSSVLSGPLSRTISRLDIGRPFGAASINMEGVIGDILIYSQVLSAVEIDSLEVFLSNKYQIPLT